MLEDRVEDYGLLQFIIGIIIELKKNMIRILVTLPRM